MKLRVQHENESMETIELKEPVTIREPIQGGLALITSADGTDHFFTIDGYYDGWGRCMPANATIDDITQVLEEVEGRRQREDPDDKLVS